MKELKPCPFCGGEAKVKIFEKKKITRTTTYYYIECNICGNQTRVKTLEKEAIEAWNRRVQECDQSTPTT